MNKKITSIGDNTFYGCTKLTNELYLLESIQSIGRIIHF